MRASEGLQAAIEGSAGVLRGASKRLVGNGLNDAERVFDAVI